MLPTFFNQTITRLRAGTKDSRGSLIPDWSNPSVLEITNCSVQPSESDILVGGRMTFGSNSSSGEHLLGIKNVYRVYTMIPVDVEAGDRIVFEGETFLVDEKPRKWRSPSGAVSNTQFTMTHWEN